MPAPDSSAYLRARSVGLLLVAISAVDLLLVSSFDSSSPLSMWWSSVGLAVALLALSRPRHWPLLLLPLVALPYLVGGVSDVSLQRITIVTLAHAGQAVVGATILTRGLRSRAGLRTMADLGYLLGAGLVCGLVAAAVEPWHQSASREAVNGPLELFTVHASSTVLLCTLVLALSHGRHFERRPWELGLQSVALLAVSCAVFIPTAGNPFAVAPFPILVWAALRFDVVVVATEVVVFSAGVTYASSVGRGPFDASTTANRFLESHLGAVTLAYIFCAVVMTLPLALIVGHRERLLEGARLDEQHFRRNFTASPLGMFFLTDAGAGLVIDEVNAAACAILHATPDELVGRGFDEVIVTLDPHRHDLAPVLDGTIETWHGPAAALGRPGSRLELALSAIDVASTPRVYSAQVLDRTQEHDAQRRLEVTLKLTDATLDTTACVILVTDSTGEIVRVNAATKDITGFGEADLVGRSLWSSPLPVLDQHETEAMFLWPNRSGFPITREQAGHTADGEPLRLVWNNNVVLDELGVPAYAVLTGIDVTAERSSTGLTAHLLQAAIGTALIGIDVLGRITVFNTGAAQMLGREPAEMLGRPFIDILDPVQLLARTGAAGDRQAFLCLIGMIGNRDESLARDWTWQTSDGHDLIVSMTLSVTDDEVEERVGFLCVGRDVTEQREAQQTLITSLERERTAFERLRSLDRAKDEFVSTVSHELRTPVTSIIGYTEMLRDGSIVEAAPEQETMLETIARNGQRLIEICNDLLLLSGFDSRVLGAVEPVDVRESLTLTDDSTRALLVGRRLDVTFEVPEAALMVLGDRVQLDRVITNLVSNAIKFTPDGGTVRVGARRRAGEVVMTVSDTGIGIPADEQEAVFQRFYRTEKAQVLAIPGTGLGLPIIAAIVNAHDGAIGLESVPGEGSTFTVTLPAYAGD
ncbi:hypothetical protein BH11ACT8_BH11ACT8_07280 [soil metagenome]